MSGPARYWSGGGSRGNRPNGRVTGNSDITGQARRNVPVAENAYSNGIGLFRITIPTASVPHSLEPLPNVVRHPILPNSPKQLRKRRVSLRLSLRPFDVSFRQGCMN